jgi:hypothetical protein
MAQSKVLVDTNAYLRLAKTIHPLLFVPFGENEYCLYIIPELNAELANHRLLSKFPWTSVEDYKENRKSFPTLGGKQKKSIADTFKHIWELAQSDEFLGPSKVDARYIAYAYELKIPIVTDDQDMTKLAKEFDITVMPTLQLLKIMLNAGHTDMKTINGLVEYWRYIADSPANLDRDYKKYFEGKH